MNYATLDDLRARFSEIELIQLTDRSETAGTIDTDVVARALQDADAEIDAYIGVRYTLPLPSVPRLLMGAACDIARYRLYDDRSTDQVTRRYEDAIRLLKMIGKGDMQIGLDAAAAPVASSSGPQFQFGARVFSADQLADYAG